MSFQMALLKMQLMAGNLSGRRSRYRLHTMRLSILMKCAAFAIGWDKRLDEIATASQSILLFF